MKGDPSQELGCISHIFSKHIYFKNIRMVVSMGVLYDVYVIWGSVCFYLRYFDYCIKFNRYS